MSNGDKGWKGAIKKIKDISKNHSKKLNMDEKEAKRMKKVFEKVAKGYAANKKQIDALALFSPGKKVKGAKLLTELATSKAVRKKTAEKIGKWLEKNRSLAFKRQTQEELMEESGKAIVTFGAGSVYADRQMQKNKSKNKTKPKKKKKFKSQY